MTKHKHTPGPWACSPNDDTATFPLEVWCRDDPRILVCRVQQHDPGAAQANAHLIAAAPDLLAALERQLDEHKRTWLTARAEVEGEGVSACLFEAEPATIAARAAIKKARGGT